MEEQNRRHVSVLLPWDMEEPYGHADGMVASLGEDRILLNNYRQIEKEKGKPWTKRLVKILEYHFDVVELRYPVRSSSMAVRCTVRHGIFTCNYQQHKIEYDYD